MGGIRVAEALGAGGVMGNTAAAVLATSRLAPADQEGGVRTEQRSTDCLS